MVGVWAMAWLNDARRRYDHARTLPPPPAHPPTPPPPADRQPSVDSDFGGSGDDSAAAGSRKNSLESVGGGSRTNSLELSTDFSDHVTSTDDELASGSTESSGGCHRTCWYWHRDNDRPPTRPSSELIDPDSRRAAWLLAAIDTADSGNVSDSACASVCALDRKSLMSSCSGTGGGVCRCTLAHYTASADALIRHVNV